MVSNRGGAGGAIESIEPVSQGKQGKPGKSSREPIDKESTFGLLPEPKNRFGSFGFSLAVNAGAGLLLVLFTVAQIHEAHVRYQEHLVYMAEPKPYVPPTPKIKLPPPPKLEVAQPKLIEPPKIKLPDPPKIEPLKVNAPAPALPAPAPRRVVAPPAPVVGSFSTPAPAPAAQKVAAETRAAGFGQPVGVAPNPNANKAANIAAVGAFGANAAGTNGSAPRQGVVSGAGFGSNTVAGTGSGNRGGSVASTGFGSGVTAGVPGSHGSIASTGFGANTAPAPATVQRTQQPVVTALVVLSKPLPQYTAEARQLHIEGDVALEVRFDANGQVEVLRVVNGLGHGLDEQARLAASHIRFKPATKDGHPIDQVSVIHVTFQLA
jgi:TonB family protein